jgi:predicted nuclease of predicted toxin-antitoxin system
MKILCDVHISIKVAKFLTSKQVETKHVNQILDKWHTKDKDICKYAVEYDFTVLTKDSDFKDSHFLSNTPKKLIKVNLGNISTNKLIEIIDKILTRLFHLFDSKSKCYVEINNEDLSVITDEE